MGVALVGSLAGACSGDERAPVLDTQGADWAITVPRKGSPCAEGARRECAVTLSQKNHLVTCYRGVETCQADGNWGECAEGSITREPALPAESVSSSQQLLSRTLAVSSALPEECAEQCDPGCRRFVEEAPVLGGGSTGGGGGQCSHDACTASSEPLSESCDPPNSCIEKVCAKDASCCTTAWDNDCVALAYKECLSRLPPLGLCYFGVFAESTLTTRNRPSAGAAMGAKGNLEIGTDAMPGTIVTTGNLSIMSPNGKSVVTPGGVWVGGNVTAQNGGGAQYTGDWNVGGEINLNGGNTINGKVLARGKIQKVTIYGDAYTGSTFGEQVNGTGARVTNSQHAAPVIEMPSTIPKRSGVCTGLPSNNDKTVEGNQTLELAPGDYGNVTVRNGNAKLILKKSGKYRFRSLTLNSGCNNCKIQLGTAASDRTGAWDVSVCGQALLEAPGSGSFIAGYNAQKLTKPEDFILYVESSDSNAAVRLGNDFKFVGVLMIPNGTFESRDRATVDGAVWAKKVSSGTDLAAVGIDKTVCEALEIPGMGPAEIVECPIETSVTPPRTVNEFGYEAECPRTTAALWKVLTWNTSVPSGSAIEFSAKVGVTPADLASQEYQLVGTAKPGSPDTTRCDAFHATAPGCPALLTEQLGLGQIQGKYLSLRVETDTTGGMPSISNFKVTYTCQFDQ